MEFYVIKGIFLFVWTSLYANNLAAIILYVMFAKTNMFIYFHIKPITFLFHTCYMKKPYYMYCIISINKLSKNILIKRTKIEKHGTNKPIGATSVSRTVT